MGGIDQPNWDEHPDAASELEYAADRYLAASTLSATKFANAVEIALTFILDMPNNWAVYYEVPANPEIHKKSIAGYPYIIFFQPREEGVLVLAYAHEKKRVGYWANRLNDYTPKMKPRSGSPIR